MGPQKLEFVHPVKKEKIVLQVNPPTDVVWDSCPIKKTNYYIFAYEKNLIIFLLFFSQNIFSQDLSQKVLQEYEDTLSTLATL